MQVRIITTDEPAETIVGTYVDENENDIQIEEWGEQRVISRDRISHYSIIGIEDDGSDEAARGEVAAAPIEGRVLEAPQTDVHIPADEVAETRWEYIRSDQAWYASANRIDHPRLAVMRASTDGGVFWEFGIEQISNIGVQVKIFDDAWVAFTERPDVFAALTRLGKGATIPDVQDALRSLGFADVTEHETPAHYRDTSED